MPIQFDAADLGIVTSDINALALRFSSLLWTYNSDNTAEVRFEGASPAPYNTNAFAIRLSIPVAADGTLVYPQTKFYFIASSNIRMSLPEPDATTRASMITISEVGDWLEGFVDSLS